MQAKRWFRLLLTGVLMTLTGCITDHSPKISTITLVAGDSQTFSAISDDPLSKLVWYLDGEIVAQNATQYAFVAEAAGTAP